MSQYPGYEKLTPIYKQYFDIQQEYPDAIIAYQLGDFYEVWQQDEWRLGHAVQAAKICDMRLTQRKTKSEDKNAPHMCGFPVHTREAYFKRMIDAGQSVVVVSQKVNGNRADKNKNIERFIEKIISPGTVVENLNEERSNYYACLFVQELGVGIALVELSTGEVKITELQPSEVNDYLSTINPTEILVCGSIELDAKKFKLVHSQKKVKIKKLAECGKILSHVYELSSPSSNLEVHLSSLGLDRWRLGALAFSNLINHLSATEYHTTLLRKLAKPKISKRLDHMAIPLNGLRSLEIFEGQNGNYEDSLVHCLDRCKTAMGRRTLRQWIKEPLVVCEDINTRLDKVSEMIEKRKFYPKLKEVYDVGRISRRLFLKHLSPYEMKQLHDSLAYSHEVLVAEGRSEAKDLLKLLNYFKNTIDFSLISRDSDEEFLFFKGDYKEQLGLDFEKLQSLTSKMMDVKDKYEEILSFFYEGKNKSFKIEQKKESIQCNGPLGFAKAVGNKSKIEEFLNLNRWPKCMSEEEIEYVIKRVTNKGPLIKMNQRVSSVELIEGDWIKVSEEVFSVRQKYLLKAQSVWREYQSQLASEYSEVLMKVSEAIGEIDTLSTFAFISLERDYVRPTILDQQEAQFSFEAIRHPVVELSPYLQEDFVPNDISLDNDKNLMCIYGANSSGKSTLLKSVAVSCILGQIGCFVPATKASFTPLEAVLTRMATFDSLSEGLSTFTMEMMELKSSLAYCSRRCLFLLDEIGRGTSVEDGEALAFATLDYLSTKKNNSVTFFATHYHNLVDKLQSYNNILICHMDAYIDASNLLYFSRELAKGPGTGSYGIEVAKSCGVPEELIRVAMNYNKQYASLKTSRYNKQVHGIICPVCDKSEVQETHHIIDQKQGKIKWVEISGVRKSINHKSNLIMICGSCHNKITRGEILLSNKDARLLKS